MEDDGNVYTEAQKLINSMSEALKDVKIYDFQCQLLIERCKAVQNWLNVLERTVPIDIIKFSSEMRELVDVLNKSMVLVTQCQSEKNRFQNKRAEFMNTYHNLTSCMDRASKEIKEAVATVLMDAIEQDNKLTLKASEAAEKDQSNINLLVLDAGKDLILGELLGEGTFGKVYKSKLYGREVAVKEFMLPEDSTKEHELLVVQKFTDHPNLLQILGQCKKGEKAYLVMELMKTDLAKLLKEKGPFIFLTAIGIMSQFAKAMFHLHENDIVHRDLKPSNILVNYLEDGTALTDVQIKVADFGISRTEFRTNAPTALELTRYKGTLGYMGPEMFNKQLPYTRKLDVYSFGIVCKEILGWSRESKIPSTCPEDLQKLIMACCSDEPDERPAFSTICAHLFTFSAGDAAETSNTVTAEISDDAGDIQRIQEYKKLPISVVKENKKLPISVVKEKKKLPMMPGILSNVMHFFQRKHGILGTISPPNPSIEGQISAMQERPPSPNPSIQGQISAMQEGGLYKTLYPDIFYHDPSLITQAWPKKPDLKPLERQHSLYSWLLLLIVLGYLAYLLLVYKGKKLIVLIFTLLLLAFTSPLNRK